MIYIIGKGGLASLAGDIAFDNMGGAEFIDYNIGIERIIEIVSGKSVFIAVGDISARRSLAAALEDKCRFPNLVHRTAVISKKCGFREGNLIHAFTHIGPYASIGRFNAIHTHCNIDHNVSVGSFNNISPGVMATGYVQIADGCNVYSGVTIIPHVKIGEGATIGAQACVTRDVKAGKTVIGVPAKELIKQ